MLRREVGIKNISERVERKKVFEILGGETLLEDD